jgi:molybdopterin-guanine dinucleotide biosynthesis protein A
MTKHNIHGLILAGGLSTRMGVDKALLIIEGKTLLYRLVEQLTGLVQHVVVSVGSLQREALYRESLEELGEKVSFALDRYPECGPLSGLHAGLSMIAEGYVFVMACDMPQLSEALFSELLAYMDKGVDVIHTPNQPFHALYHARMVSQIEEALEAQDFRLMGLLRRLQTLEVTPQEQRGASIFTNLNTPADYNKYRMEQGF